MYGDHIWFETNVSGDYCYVGEQHCIARALVSTVYDQCTSALLSKLFPLLTIILRNTYTLQCLNWCYM